MSLYSTFIRPLLASFTAPAPAATPTKDADLVDEATARALLCKRIADFGSQAKYARYLGVSNQYVFKAKAGETPITGKILDDLDLVRDTTIRYRLAP